MWVLPLSSCHLDSAVWLLIETMAGMCVMCSRVWLQMRGPSVEGTDASAAPADWTQTEMSSSSLHRQQKTSPICRNHSKPHQAVVSVFKCKRKKCFYFQKEVMKNNLCDNNIASTKLLRFRHSKKLWMMLVVSNILQKNGNNTKLPCGYMLL